MTIKNKTEYVWVNVICMRTWNDFVFISGQNILNWNILKENVWWLWLASLSRKSRINLLAQFLLLEKSTLSLSLSHPTEMFTILPTSVSRWFVQTTFSLFQECSRMFELLFWIVCYLCLLFFSVSNVYLCVSCDACAFIGYLFKRCKHSKK